MEYHEVLKELFRLKAVKQLCKMLFDIQITQGQEQIIRCIAFGEYKRVSIVCPTRYGKSFSVSMGVILWIISHKNKKVALIAPTNDKTTIIRNHIAFFVSKNEFLTSLLNTNKRGIDRIRIEISKKRMTWKNGVELRTLSAEGKGEGLMGFGADLLIVDETCDIDYEVYRSRLTRMLGDNPDTIYVEIGNPWHKDNHFWQHWIDTNWHKIHIGYRQALTEGRISQEFITEQKEQLTDREFQVLYEAVFPDTSEDALINWDWINYAMHNNFIEMPTDIVQIGVDVAEQGNDYTVVTIVRKNIQLNTFKVIDIPSWGKTDLMPTVAKILPLIEKHKPFKINIDATGVGSGVYSRLEEIKREGRINCEVIAFKGGLAPMRTEIKQRFLNLKSESYWHLRKLFEDKKIQIPNHNELVKQLSQMKWELNSSEKIRIRDPGTKQGDTSEEKSPDFSDSLNIACWQGSQIPLIFSNISI